MTTAITELVSRMADTMAAQPLNEVMGAFAREQAPKAEPAISPVRIPRMGRCS
ncbi:MAG: hypothetical protein ACRDXC_01810 [Acidimicrobiales bacterium]